MADAGDTQALALRQVEALREQCDGEAGGRAVMLGTKVCALHGIPLPAWLAGEFVRRHQLVEEACASSWDQAFGRPWPAHTRLSTVRRQAARLKGVHAAVWEMAKAHPEKALRRDSIFNDVAAAMNIGMSPGAVERVYYQAVAAGFVNVATYRRAFLMQVPEVQDLSTNPEDP